eukprot:TRINITY_DN12132_c0_g1_i5.p1 TRINITY_DN12132_c0_g1~~TRINITY_DN12132_c0_g1_i5.p1  ORF type:complete len:429 (+),score=158.98 TRINITY_DN12132_c0_g1_i5:171-1457(+)
MCIRDRSYCCGTGEATIDASLNASLVSCLKSIERMYPLHFDKAVAAAISNTRKVASKKDALTVDSDSVIRFISRHFVGTKFELLDVSGAVGKGSSASSLPLLSCLLHHVPAVRQLAIVALTKQLTASSSSTSPSLFASEIKGIKATHEDDESAATTTTEGTLMPLLTASISSETSPAVGVVCVTLVKSVLDMYLAAIASKNTDVNCNVMGTALSTLISAAWRMVSSSLEEGLISADSSAVAVALGQLCSKSVSALRPHGVAYSVYSEALYILTTLALAESASTSSSVEGATTFMDMLGAVCDVKDTTAKPTAATKKGGKKAAAESSSDDSSDDEATAAASKSAAAKKKTNAFVAEKVLCGSAVSDMWDAVSKAPGCGGADVISRLIEEYESSVRLLGTAFDKTTTVGQNRFVSQNSCLLYTSPSPRDS